MRKSILVIDNDLDMQDLLEEILREHDYDVHFYDDPDVIFPMIEKHRPDVILLDYNLDGVNGGELCMMIKENPDTKEIPVVLFSAYPRMIYSLKQYGYDAFIEKPFDIDEFYQTIAAFSNR